MSSETVERPEPREDGSYPEPKWEGRWLVRYEHEGRQCERHFDLARHEYRGWQCKDNPTVGPLLEDGDRWYPVGLDGAAPSKEPEPTPAEPQSLKGDHGELRAVLKLQLANSVLDRLASDESLAALAAFRGDARREEPTDDDVAAIKAENDRYREIYGCLSCDESHPRGVMCPPHEVRSFEPWWRKKLSALAAQRDAAQSERDKAIAEANRRDEKWKAGIQEACGCRIAFDVWQSDDSLEQFIGKLKARAESAERELTEKAADYERACQTIALMHDAATEKGQGPIRGVVEDIEDLRKERDRLREDAELFREAAEHGMTLFQPGGKFHHLAAESWPPETGGFCVVRCGLAALENEVDRLREDKEKCEVWWECRLSATKKALAFAEQERDRLREDAALAVKERDEARQQKDKAIAFLNDAWPKIHAALDEAAIPRPWQEANGCEYLVKRIKELASRGQSAPRPLPNLDPVGVQWLREWIERGLTYGPGTEPYKRSNVARVLLDWAESAQPAPASIESRLSKVEAAVAKMEGER